MKSFDNEGEELAWFVGLIEGEGSFCVSTPQAKESRSQFYLGMSDLDVIERVRGILGSWGIDLNVHQAPKDKRWKDPKQIYRITTPRASYLKTIIDKCYPYFSEKKQSDCDRVLKNLADRGLL